MRAQRVTLSARAGGPLERRLSTLLNGVSPKGLRADVRPALSPLGRASRTPLSISSLLVTREFACVMLEVILDERGDEVIAMIVAGMTA